MTLISPDLELYKNLIQILDEKKITYDPKLLEEVYLFAKEAHQGQYRQSGHPYICHPLETALTVAYLGADESSVLAAILHDVPEDTDRTLEEIEAFFGTTVGSIVEALTKLSKVYYKSSMGDRQLHSLRKLCLQIAQDPRVLVVKLSDRYHNMLTLHHLRVEKQHRIAKETLEIYAPLARLYGIYDLGQKLEDACFKILQSEEYEKIQAHVCEADRLRKSQLLHMKNKLEKALEEKEVPFFEIHGRYKNYYSIYKKMLRDQKKVQEMYDLYALRIVVPNETICYQALGVLHDVYKPKPGRFKDYIATPKANNYQSLHSTVIGERGDWLEVQIRTQMMHDHAEFGVASHHNYKGGSYEEFQKIVDSLRTLEDTDTFMQELQDDILQEKMMIFSPKGDLVMLPFGSCAIDYMYSLNLDLELTTFQALVNGQSHSLVAPLNHGDTIEILYFDLKGEGPQSWWMKHVKTRRAKQKIQEFLQKKSYEESREIGRILLEQEFAHENKSLHVDLSKERQTKSLEAFRKKDWGEVLASIGRGEVTSSQVYAILFPEFDLDDWQLLKRIIKLVLQKMKKLTNVPDGVRIQVLIEAYDRPGLLKEILEVFYQKKITLLEVSSRGHDVKRIAYELAKNGLAFMKNEAYISRTMIEARFYKHEDLIAVFDRMELIPGIVRSSRVYRPNQIRFYVLAILTLILTLSQPFLTVAWLKSQWFLENIPMDILKALPLYLGNALTILMLLLLRKMSRKTFPQFGETKKFWYWSVSIVAILILSVCIENYYFDLGNQLYILLAISAILLLILWLAYHKDKKKMQGLWKYDNVKS